MPSGGSTSSISPSRRHRVWLRGPAAPRAAPGAPAISHNRRLPGRSASCVLAENVLACPCGGRRTVTAFVVDTKGY